MRVLVAGATGVLGRALLPVLVGAGHQVVGTTRSPDRVGMIEAAGATGVVCHALDRDAVHRTVAEAAPEVVVHQLTALPHSFTKLRRAAEPTNRLRREGTRHLVDAAVAAGARRVIAESIAFVYQPGSGLADEHEPRFTDAPPPYGAMIAAVSELERAVTRTPGIEGIVLRYGTLYGPGTWYASDGDLTRRLRQRRMPVIGSGAGVTSFLHVDDAATATLRALSHGAPRGIYNVTDGEPVTFSELLPTLAELLGAKPPLHLPAWLARPVAGSAGIAVMTRQRGAANDRIKRELGWQPQHASWRAGFAVEFNKRSGSSR
jgi:2-alkyl-3-oxoalkanoate reductase